MHGSLHAMLPTAALDGVHSSWATLEVQSYTEYILGIPHSLPSYLLCYLPSIACKSAFSVSISPPSKDSANSLSLVPRRH